MIKNKKLLLEKLIEEGNTIDNHCHIAERIIELSDYKCPDIKCEYLIKHWDIYFCWRKTEEIK